MTRWDGAPRRPAARIGPGGWLRVALRGSAMGTVVFGGLVLLLALRVLERPLFGARRPATPWITVGVCRAALAILGLRRAVHGRPLAHPGAMMANHASWLDVFVLNAAAPIYFVAKAEVAGWPGVGWLARATGTVFVLRRRGEAARQRDALGARLAAGHVLCVFPEGTSTDGRRVLAFKTTLFAPLLEAGAREPLAVQGVTVAYHPPPGAPAAFYGWWGDAGFGASLLEMLAAPCHGAVGVRYHPPQQVREAADRKALARAVEAEVRAGFAAEGISAPAP